MTPPQLLETVTISRKTPGDGKVELQEETALQLEEVASELVGEVRGQSASADVEAMDCTCAKAASRGAHRHFYLHCELFRQLTPGDVLNLYFIPGERRVVLASEGL
jgi:hypothetical protein